MACCSHGRSRQGSSTAPTRARPRIEVSRPPQHIAEPASPVVQAGTGRATLSLMLTSLTGWAVACGLAALGAAMQQAPPPAQPPPPPEPILKVGDQRTRVRAPGLRRQGAQAVRLQGQDRRSCLVSRGVHCWLNGRVPVAPCERRQPEVLRKRRLLRSQRGRRRHQQEVRRARRGGLPHPERSGKEDRDGLWRRQRAAAAGMRWTFYIGPTGVLSTSIRRSAPRPPGRRRQTPRSAEDQTEIAVLQSCAGRYEVARAAVSAGRKPPPARGSRTAPRLKMDWS